MTVSKTELGISLESSSRGLQAGYINSDDQVMHADRHMHAAGVSSAEREAVADEVAKSSLGGLFGPNPTTAVSAVLSAATIATGAKVLETINGTGAVGKKIASNVEPNKTLGQALEETVNGIPHAANGNQPKSIAGLAKGVGAIAAAMAVADVARA
jgi:hypothetical protein